MTVLSQVLASGLASGSVYALMALALVITYKTTGIANFAQGDMATLSAYVAYTVTSGPVSGIDVGVALVFAFWLGFGFEYAVVRRARMRSHLGLLVLTLGFSLTLFGLTGWLWGADPRPFPSPTPAEAFVRIGSARVPALSVVTIVMSCVLTLLAFAVFRFTRLGLAMRATQQDAEAARMSGVPVRTLSAVAFGMSSVLGAVAALLSAPLLTLEPTLMFDPLLKGFAAAVLGGLAHPAGAVLGGYLLGVTETVLGTYVSLESESLLAFAVIVLVLFIRPRGLFGPAGKSG